MTTSENSEAKSHTPSFLFWGVVILCALPTLLQWADINLGLPDQRLDVKLAASLSARARADLLLFCLRGTIAHNLLEWTAVSVAILTAIIAFTHFAMTRTLISPVIGSALFWSGCLDAYHTLASDHFMGRVADADHFIPLTWTMSRLCGCVILIIGGGILLVADKLRKGHETTIVAASVALFGIGSCAVLVTAATTARLPQCQFPGSFVHRPYDLIPVALYIAVGLPIFWIIQQRVANKFSCGLLLSLIPDSVAELHMALGSSSLFDAHFNAAHFLKIVAYGLPLAGLLLDYVDTYKAKSEAMARLEQSRKEAEIALRAKNEFIANVSHEFRTPINGIMGTIDVLADDCSSADQREHIQTIRYCSGALLDLVNNILDSSKIDAGKLSLDESPFSLRALLDDTLAVIRPIAIARGLTLRQHFSGTTSLYLVGDQQRIRQVMLNLLSNAIKFTERGFVGVDVAATQTEDRSVRLTVSIQDSGIGISEEAREAIFQPFVQADSSTTRLYGGTGLGLSISRALVLLMGGNLEVVSKLGAGSTFSFALTLAKVSGRAPEPAAYGAKMTRSSTPLRILLAEDNPVNAKLAVRLLQRMGHTVEVAANGLRALELFERTEFDLILMDCQMPLMDGFDATRTIRRMDGKSRIPIVALTANVMEADRQKCFDSGMDAVFTKPIVQEKLFALLETVGRSGVVNAGHARLSNESPRDKVMAVQLT